MSSTTATEKPASRVQSASNKDQQETPVENAEIKTEKTPSRPPSAAGREASAGIPAAEGSFSTIGLLLHATPVIESSATDTSTELRPGSASKNATLNNSSRPPSASTAPKAHPTTDSRPSSAAGHTDEAEAHGYCIVTAPYRPPSASQNTQGLSSAANSRPSSAITKTHHSTSPVRAGSRPPSASQKTNDAHSPVRTGSRPPSANQKTNDAHSPVRTGSRPPSASQKTHDAHSPVPAGSGSRPPSANPKTNDSTAVTGSRPPSANPKSNGDHATPPPIGSRPSTGSQRTDTTNLGESGGTPAPTNSRPPSAARTTGSRPPSANPKQEETTTHHPTTDQSDTSNLFHGIHGIATQPIIGRPPSAAKKASSDETNASSDPKPIEDPPKSPRVRSATKNPST